MVTGCAGAQPAPAAWLGSKPPTRQQHETGCAMSQTSSGPASRGGADDALLEALRRVADYLEPQLDELVDRLVEHYRDQIPGYTAIPAQPARDSTRETLEAWILQIRSGQLPEDADRSAIADQARKWWGLGTPLDISVRTLQLGARWIVDLTRNAAADLDLGQQQVVEVMDLGWRWAILNAAVVGDVHRELDVAAARRDAARLADFVRDLASGRMTDERLVDEASVYGLDVTMPYFTVRASCGDTAAANAAEAQIRWSGAAGERRVLQATVDGQIYALAPQRPTAPDGLTIAVGPAALLSEAHTSFADAEEALGTALAFGISGAVDLESLLPLPIATASQRLASRISEQRLTRLDELGLGGADIEHTVLTLLDCNMNVEDTARSLHLHRNSVRYRVGRFQELTALDIHCTDDLITTWWLLKWRQAGRGGSERPRD
jgi:hypothetical protein